MFLGVLEIYSGNCIIQEFIGICAGIWMRVCVFKAVNTEACCQSLLLYFNGPICGTWALLATPKVTHLQNPGNTRLVKAAINNIQASSEHADTMQSILSSKTGNES